MCCILNILSHCFGILHKVITTCLVCLVGYVICLALTFAIIAGVALGYNYSIAEYMDTKDEEVSVYLKRGKFGEEVIPEQLEIGRRSGGAGGSGDTGGGDGGGEAGPGAYMENDPVALRRSNNELIAAENYERNLKELTTETLEENFRKMNAINSITSSTTSKANQEVFDSFQPQLGNNSVEQNDDGLHFVEPPPIKEDFNTFLTLPLDTVQKQSKPKDPIENLMDKLKEYRGASKEDFIKIIEAELARPKKSKQQNGFSEQILQDVKNTMENTMEPSEDVGMSLPWNETDLSINKYGKKKSPKPQYQANILPWFDKRLSKAKRNLKREPSVEKSDAMAAENFLKIFDYMKHLMPLPYAFNKTASLANLKLKYRPTSTQFENRDNHTVEEPEDEWRRTDEKITELPTGDEGDDVDDDRPDDEASEGAASV